MKVVIEIPEKMYQKIIAGTYDYGDMNVIIQNGTQYDGRPHGEWIEHRTQDCFGSFHSEYECSNCHYDVWQNTKWSFCPNCGADMREIRKEQNLPFRLDCPCDDCKKMCIKCVDSCKKFREWKER